MLLDDILAFNVSRVLQQTYSFSIYTRAQQITLTILPYFTAPLSVLGSGLILYVIYKERRTKLKESYHRLMLGLSTMNFLNSLSIIVLSNWAVPAFVDYPMASGNSTTCSIAGFFLNLVFGSMWYSFFLSLNFALRIKCERSPQCIARWCEPWGHFFGFLYPVVSGSIAAAAGHMNPMEQLTGWCWAMDFPNGCSSREDVLCLRAEDQEGTSDAATIIIVFIGITICMGLIILKVRRTELNMHAYAGSSVARRMTRTRQSGKQALWYIGAFCAVYLPIVGLMTLGTDYTRHSQGLYFAFAFLTKLLTPLQGFFNAIIYFRTNFRSLLQEGRTLSFLSNWADRISSLRHSRTTTTTDTTRVATTRSSNGDVSGEVQLAATSGQHNHADAPVSPDSESALSNGQQGDSTTKNVVEGSD